MRKLLMRKDRRSVVLECGDCVVVVELSISCSRGQVKGETNDPPLSLFEGIKGRLGCGVELRYRVSLRGERSNLVAGC